MKRRLAFMLSLIVLCATLTGCWNYRGMNELDIVTGVAVDWDEQNGLYQLTFEIADVASATPEDAMKTKYVESEGSTMLDAVRNAKKRLINKLYFGNMQTLIISRQLARQGVFPILEGFIRDGELRETLAVVVSREDTAKEIILAQGIDSLIVSYEIKKVIEEDGQATASTKMTALYQAYNALKGKGKVLVLPTFHCTVNNEETVPEANGAALFLEDKLIGYFTPEETRFYLFVIDEIKGGTLSFGYEDNDRDNIALEIKQSKTKRAYSYENGRLKISLDISSDVTLIESKPGMKLSEADDQRKLEERAAAVLKERILRVTETAQTQFGVDVFGFGSMVYKDDPDLWRQLDGDWDAIFAAAEFDVQTKVKTLHTGVLTEY